MRQLIFCGAAMTALFSAASAEPAKFPPAMDQSTLEEEGLYAAAAYEDYKAWLDGKITKEIEHDAEFTVLMDQLDLTLTQKHSLAWWMAGDELLDFYSGGMGYLCRSGDVDHLSPMNWFAVGAEAKEKFCDWKIWRVEFNPDSEVFPALAGKAFDLKGATDWLRSKNVGLKSLGKGLSVNWSEFPGIGDLTVLDRATHKVSWSAKSCPAIFNILTGIEGKDITAIDMPGYGLDDKYERPDLGTSYGAVTVTTLGDIEIEFGPVSELARSVISQIREAMETCTPDKED